MASIQTGIELNDQFSSVIYNIINAVNMAVSSMEDMQQTMNADIDTSGIQGIRDEINQATMAMDEMNRTIADNADEQERFNNQIRDGTTNADNLLGTIKKAVGAYVSIQAVGNVLNISDELTQTTSRLDMMNDGMQTTEELVNMVYAAAQDARGSFSDMADVVARFGNNAGDAFSSSAEIVAFADLVQKQMTVAGASTTEASNAMLQLSQALGSGVLRGDELNSIFEQAPNLIQNIADYLDVPIGTIREMASEGELTADVVKAAIFSASDEINANFEAMPMTWGQVWQSMQNTALIAFQPVLQKINDLANNSNFQKIANKVTNLMANVAVAVLNVFDLLATGASFVSDNWSVIEPVILGVATAFGVYAGALAVYNTAQAISNGLKAIAAFRESVHAAATMMATGATFAATAAQYGFNAALAACPLFWIVSLILVLIVLIAVFASKLAESAGISTSAFGIICGMINVVIQWFKNLGLWVANVALGIGMALNACGYNMKTAFENSILNIKAVFYDLVAVALECVAKIAKGLNKLPGVDIDYKGINNTADEYVQKAENAIGEKGEYKNIASEFQYGMSTFSAFDDGWMSNAFDKGEEWGTKISDKISNLGISFDESDIAYDLSSYMDNTTESLDGISDSLEVSEEELKYLRDIAEQESINRFTTAEVTINQTNNNNISSEMDLDGVVSGITDAVNEAVEIVTEGVHV